MDAQHLTAAMIANGFQQCPDGSWSKANPKSVEAFPVEREGTLRKQILEWCGQRWPVWKVVTTRTDQRSTLEVGCADMLVFGPFPMVLILELKSKTGKQSGAQLSWECQMRALSWPTHVIRSFEEFLALARGESGTDG